MKTDRNYPSAFAKLLLSASILSTLLMPIGATAKPASKPTAKALAKTGARKAQSARPKAPGVLRLKQHAFPDVTMGMPVAYTVLLPAKWSAQGKIEWQPVGEVPFPQQIIEISSPQKGRISFEPMMTFSYMEGPDIPSQGVPPPTDFPQWLVQALAQTNPKISNVKLVKSSRDAKAEALLKKMDTSTGGVGGMQQEIHIIVLDYDEENITRRGEVNATYVRYAPNYSANLNSQMWSISPGTSISAPANQFAAHRTALLNVANTLRPTPQWHIQSQAVIAEMSRRRTANNWEIIKARGRQISQLSDADYAKYKKDMSGSDEAQRKRINGIYETDDFKDTNGNIVNLPMHYNHVFSDGKGNYVLSNNSQDKPGALWKPIRPIK
jgi:hypothetical protein